MSTLDSLPPEQFYTGLIADLYEPLAGGLPQFEPYQRFIERYGGPTLELGCGSGLPMLDLIELGYDVEGLDASVDMLRVCREKAAGRNVTATLHEGLFQSFRLPRKFKSIYVPSASFTLLTTDGDAMATLENIFDHLDDSGALFLPLEVFNVAELEMSLDKFRESVDPAGNKLRVGMTALDCSQDGRDLSVTLRYEKHYPLGDMEVIERVWRRRSWSNDQITPMIAAAGFSRQKVLADADQLSFAIIAEV